MFRVSGLERLGGGDPIRDHEGILLWEATKLHNHHHRHHHHHHQHHHWGGASGLTGSEFRVAGFRVLGLRASRDGGMDPDSGPIRILNMVFSMFSSIWGVSVN